MKFEHHDKRPGQPPESIDARARAELDKAGELLEKRNALFFNAHDIPPELRVEGTQRYRKFLEKEFALHENRNFVISPLAQRMFVAGFAIARMTDQKAGSCQITGAPL